MDPIVLRPDMRTAGGEVNDIMVDGQFAGTMTLVYREGGRMTGSVQLDRDMLHPRDKKRVLEQVSAYIQSFVQAADISSSDVLITYSPFEQILSAADAAGDTMDERTAEDADLEWMEAEYELVLVSKSRNRLHYHVYDDARRLIAESFLRASDDSVTGSIRWRIRPDDDEMELVTELIVSDFDEDSVDRFRLDQYYRKELLETVELTHEDAPELPDGGRASRGEDNFSVRLIRDDGDMLTYEIRSKADGNRPIGTATVDIEERRLTGFIDFRERRHADDAGAIAAVLMRELDKEKDYDGLNLSLMHRNQLIDEFVIENETVH